MQLNFDDHLCKSKLVGLWWSIETVLYLDDGFYNWKD
jgi:hypothetical protein